MERNFKKDTYHHLYNRGANKLDIYRDDGDYKYFLRRLKHYSEKYSISILCYCLMPNHFHLFVKQNTSELSIGKMIGSLINSYTKTVNLKYDRSGVLFEGPTKSRHIMDESYFLWLFKYIILNPVEAELVNRTTDWEYSAIHEYLGYRKNELLNMDEMGEILGPVSQIRDFLVLD